MIPDSLSPDLVRLAELELACGNAVDRVDVGVWSRCPLAVVFVRPLHFDRTPAVPDGVERWESRDPHYAREAGYVCTRTRHSLSGPIDGGG